VPSHRRLGRLGDEPDAIARYKVDPVRLNEYPVGITNPTICGGTPKRSIDSIAFGSADSLLVVANASAAGSRTARTNCLNGIRADPNHQSENENDENHKSEIKRADQFSEV
jgi:hypothetical protein